MNDNILTSREAAELFVQGFNCSQVVLSKVSEEYGLDKDMACHIASAFGGGMNCGNVCGCVTGALMALGLVYGFDQPGEQELAAQIREKTLEFEKRFAQENGSILCRELLQCDITVPEELEALKKSGKMLQLCPCLAESASTILADML